MRATLANPRIRSSQSSAIRNQIDQANTDIESARADADRAQAQLREAQANRADLQITAPFEGTVSTRSVEPGEIIAVGTTIITLINPKEIYLRAYVTEADIGRVKLGQAARVYLDSNPTQPLEAVVARVDPEAAFTPENTYFKDDRVKQVVGVKLMLKDPQGFAKARNAGRRHDTDRRRMVDPQIAQSKLTYDYRPVPLTSPERDHFVG